MGNPFLYPQTRHRRTRSPKQFKDYRQYKPDLREEFSAQCVYCRALDRFKGWEGFGVDHYRPKSLFPHLVVEYRNLFYSCNRCNSLKREYWATFLDQQKQIFIPNPCDYVMFEHLRYRGGRVDHVSPAGQFSIDRLDLNDPIAIDFRGSVIKALLLAEARMDDIVQTIGDIKKKLKRAKGVRRIQLSRDLKAAEENRRELESTVRGLVG